jgi:hypothetical protein
MICDLRGQQIASSSHLTLPISDVGACHAGEVARPSLQQAHGKQPSDFIIRHFLDYLVYFQ